MERKGKWLKAIGVRKRVLHGVVRQFRMDKRISVSRLFVLVTVEVAWSVVFQNYEPIPLQSVERCTRRVTSIAIYFLLIDRRYFRRNRSHANRQPAAQSRITSMNSSPFSISRIFFHDHLLIIDRIIARLIDRYDLPLIIGESAYPNRSNKPREDNGIKVKTMLARINYRSLRFAAPEFRKSFCSHDSFLYYQIFGNLSLNFVTNYL